jgi:hypothetical protein
VQTSSAFHGSISDFSAVLAVDSLCTLATLNFQCLEPQPKLKEGIDCLELRILTIRYLDKGISLQLNRLEKLPGVLGEVDPFSDVLDSVEVSIKKISQ